MQITVDLPNDITRHSDPGREALEAVAIAGYRSGKLISYQAARLLGLGSRFEFEALLKARGIYDHAYAPADLNEDWNTLRKLPERSGNVDALPSLR
jgi:predicted HTH domain antitoxin